MALNDYNGLRSSIELHSRRDDVSELLDDAILLAEKSIDKGLMLRTNEHRATATINTANRFIRLPDDFLQMRSLRAQVGAVFHDLYFVVDEAMDIKSVAGRPVYYTINHQIEFDRIPDQEYPLEMKYYKKITPLSETNITNNVLTDYPDLYLFGGLAAIYRMVRDEDQAMYYDQVFAQALATANAQEKRGRYGTAPAMRSERRVP